MRVRLFTAFILGCSGLAGQKTPADSAYEKAFAYAEQKNFDSCVLAIKPAMKSSGAPKELRLLAAHCHSAKKNYPDAIQHLRIVAEEFPDQVGVREDIIALLFYSGKYREARNTAYRYAEAIKDDGGAVSDRLYLLMAQADLACGKAAAALEHARMAKQSVDDESKYQSIIIESRALIALGNLSEADISLSYAESMRQSELHALLRANIAEIGWAGQKFAEEKRADIVALYEKLSRSENAEVKAAALKNMERVKTAKNS